MNTLRAKMALLLVASIVSVVALITLAIIYASVVPGSVMIDMFARQWITMERLASHGPGAADLSPRPAPGEVDQEQTELFRAATARLGTPLDLVITHKDETASPRFRTLSVRVGTSGWLLHDIVVPIRDSRRWMWFAFIAIGVGTVAVFSAYRMTKPLAMLESAVEAVTPDAILPVLPERGPAEVRATAAALNSLSARLKRVIESRMRLVAAAGHDLRTPLTRMRLRAEFVRDDEERSLWLKDIDELGRIADSAIQLVREESAKELTEIVPIHELVRSVAAELRDQNFEIDVGDTGEAYVKASRLALNRALRNLLINAATHGLRGIVSVTGGAMAQITIADQGPGIAPDLLDQVFEPFFRADRARIQQIPGAGLGLTISLEIVRRAGGDISIANRPDGGLLQIVELPTVSVSAEVMA
ncbi:ATP-binding protein [Bradyrhizobium sp. LHD-71]|uniref:ATP-binding protein n=1 Tax=Bradyrhizobium sp. LHD-71 TaxID=3072141 RepID=UPI00280F3642|nr:ATP-binding protein [Bradyrhizobium sp. LHD-71]MDQ8729352.1 ATP-binding protein [Bradyrhizobium sp. LHD-71]